MYGKAFSHLVARWNILLFFEALKCGFKFVTRHRIVCYIFLVPEYNNISRPFAGHDKR